MDELNRPKFQCDVCPTKPSFLTLGESALHQKFHINVKNFTFLCQWPSCGLTFLSYPGLDVHITRCHGQLRHIPQEATVLKYCSADGCHEVFHSTKLLCQHLIVYHQQEKGDKTQCPFRDECKTSHFFPLASFRTHLSQKHPGWGKSTTAHQAISTCADGTEQDENSSENIDAVWEDTNMVNDDESQPQLTAQPAEPPENDEDTIFAMKLQFTRSLAMFYLRLEAQHHIPASTIQVIAEGLAELTRASQLIVKKTLEEQLDNLEVFDIDRRETVCNNVLSGNPMYICHQSNHGLPSMKTNALRKKYYRTHFKYLKPQEINLSKDTNDPKLVYYISPQETLHVLLSRPIIQEEILASFNRVSTDGILEDYVDGSLIKERRQAIGEKTIDIFIYQDAFLGTRDLSSAADSNDILGVYMTLGNLRPHLRSKVDCMQLVMLIPNYKQMFQDFKMKHFRIIAEACKKLQVEGVEFLGEKVKVQLQFLLGDNKGQHEIGGFIQSFSHEYFCRYCPMTKTEILTEPWKVAPLRTPASYEEAVRSVPHNRKTFMGVSGPDYSCPFNKLSNFHVADPSLPPCVGHDLFEGTFNYDLVPILKHFIEEKWFSYHVLNKRLKTFKYIDHDSRNKPAKVKGNLNKKTASSLQEPKLGGHAIQNWTLLRLLPFILGDDLIKNPEDVYWKIYLKLKKITEYVCAPSISIQQLGHLKVLTEEYCMEREEILGDGKPKHHYFAHFPDLIEIMGPIFLLQTLRFESFHQFFKEAARAGRNFKHIGYSLIKKYCLYFSYVCAGTPFSKGVKMIEECMSISTFATSNLDETVLDAILSSFSARNIGEDAAVMSSIIVDEVLFKKGKWLLLGNGDEDSVIVGCIQYVVLDGSQVYLTMQDYIAKPLESIGIHVVQTDKNHWSCIPMSEIYYPCSHSMYEWGDHEVCFSLKNSLARKAPSLL